MKKSLLPVVLVAMTSAIPVLSQASKGQDDEKWQQQGKAYIRTLPALAPRPHINVDDQPSVVVLKYDPPPRPVFKGTANSKN